MRIIRGKYGRRRFQVPSSFKARPTTDFAKESLFNVIENLVDLEGLKALDLFAGTGSISLEMISRGCSHVTAIEVSREHAGFISKTADQLGEKEMFVFCGDVFKFLKSGRKQPFDLIFADPPYDLEKTSELPEIIMNENWLNDGGLFILEHSDKKDFSQSPYFIQQRNYGGVNFSFFSKEGEKTNA